jgi:hypothetical protein
MNADRVQAAAPAASVNLAVHDDRGAKQVFLRLRENHVRKSCPGSTGLQSRSLGKPEGGQP